MIPTQERLSAFYEISLAIGPGETLEATAGRGLAAYLEQLDCSAGAVLEQVRDDSAKTHRYRLLKRLPAGTHPDSALESAFDAIPETADDERAFRESLPVVERTDDGAQYAIMRLPEYGLLVLGTGNQGLDEETVLALDSLNSKFAEACSGKRTETALREERNRFWAVFETIQEPVANLVFREGEPLIKRVNEAFEETFGYREADAVGRSINELIVPEAEQSEAGALDDAAIDGETMTKKVRRETADGVGDFLFRGAPVETASAHEHFAMYVDITEEKARQRKLEQLYEETEQILAGESPKAVCERTIAAAGEIIDLSLAGIHLYERSQEALVPVATTEGVTEVFGGEPASYTDRDTVVWNVYESGEPAFIDDTATFEGSLPGGETPMGSIIVLPLGNHGVFIISALEAEAFDETDFYFARMLSALVETALGRAKRAEGLEGIQAVTRETLEATSHEEVAEEVLGQIPAVLDMPLAAIWEYDSGQEALQPLASTEKARDLIGEQPTLSGNNSLRSRAFQQDRIHIIPDLETHPEVYNDNSIFGSEIIVPIGEFGVLVTGSTYTGSFGQSERRLLETLGANIETTMRLISRRQEMELLDQVLARILRHNIRNDLTIIQGFAQEIKSEADGEAASHVERIVDRCRSLQSTAEHAADIRHIVTNRERRERLSLPETVGEVVRAVQDEYPAVEITTRFDAAPEIVVHPDLPVALRHLIENGIEHDTGGSPRIAVSVFETEQRVGIEVADDGPGIPEHEITALERHGESALEHGSGAGLWIVDRVAEYSGGALTFDVSSEGTVARIAFER